MFGEGYVTFDGIDCIYIESKDEIKLIPTNKDDFRRLSDHFNDHNFLFHYSDGTDKNCVAFIDRVSLNFIHSVSFIPVYSLQLFNDNPVSCMEITGPTIDQIFHPAGYYNFFKPKTGDNSAIDIIKESETADRWTITVNDIPVDICLKYGQILKWGISSDIMLHPRIVASFPPTKNCGFLYQIYSIITRFLQITQYNGNIGRCVVHLEGCSPEYNSGYLRDWKQAKNEERFFNQIEYRIIKPYIERLLQFSADNLDMSLRFLPNATYRWMRTDYTPDTLLSLFAAFESEYAANISFYEPSQPPDISELKESILKRVHEFSREKLSNAERNFLNQVEQRINDTGNQVGQFRKMKNVFRALSPVLNKCAQHLFIRQRIGNEEGFSPKELSHIAKEIVDLRAQITHEYTLSEFNDIQAEYIHFLEILVHAQMLKRAGIDDKGIEILLGAVFHCNFEYMSVLMSGRE